MTHSIFDNHRQGLKKAHNPLSARQGLKKGPTELAKQGGIYGINKFNILKELLQDTNIAIKTETVPKSDIINDVTVEVENIVSGQNDLENTLNLFPNNIFVKENEEVSKDAEENENENKSESENESENEESESESESESEIKQTMNKDEAKKEIGTIQQKIKRLQDTNAFYINMKTKTQNIKEFKKNEKEIKKLNSDLELLKGML